MIKAQQKNLHKPKQQAEKTLEPRDDMLDKIKKRQFMLRRMTKSFVPKSAKASNEEGAEVMPAIEEEKEGPSLTVAAIYEKAKARRLALEGSCSEDEDDFDDEDDDW